MIKLKDLMVENANPLIKNLYRKKRSIIDKYTNESDPEKRERLWKIFVKLDDKYQKLKKIDPHEIEKSHFLKSQYTGHIRSDAYNRYEQPGGLSWLGSKSKYPTLLGTEQHGPYEVEYRQSNETLKYLKVDKDGEVVRDEQGNAVFMTPEEIDAAGYIKTETSVVAFINDKPIGNASNEFGAVGVWVEKKYQNLGIGLMLLSKHIELRPDVMSKKRTIGQMTDAGIALTSSYFDYMVKKHGKNWWYYINK